MLDWSRLTLKLGRLGRLRCEPGWSLPENWGQLLPDFDLWCVWSGRGRMRLVDRTIDLHPGVVVWARPGGLYQAEQDPTDRLGVSFIHFELLSPEGRPLSKEHARWPLPPEALTMADASYIDTVTRRMAELVGNWPSAQSVDAATAGAIAHSLLWALLRDYEAAARQQQSDAGTQRHHRQVVLALASRISESPQQAPSVAQMARQCGYSADHFSRVFRSVLGQSPQDYVVSARVNRARQLLLESSLSVSQIADVLGYQDVFFFSRQFKQKVGRTPSAYRRRPSRAPVAGGDA
jgi:AraC-like DNA-binding protein